MARRALTASQVTALDKDGVHWIAPSLYMQIRQGQGTRSYLFRWGRDGENQWMGLGSVADKTLSEARGEAAQLRSLVRRGGDPRDQAPNGADQPEKRAKAPTFAWCAERYIESHSPSWKNDKHIAQWKSTIQSYVNPVIGKLPVDKVGVDHVMEVLEPIWREKPETAGRVRGRIEKILGWATAMEHRSGDNPAAWDGALSHLLPPLSKVRKVEHHKAMDYREVPKLVAELLANGSESARALAFTILTAARTGETIGATPAEIDVKAKLWVLPAARMKAGREHRVPLSDAAMQFVSLDRPYLFEGLKPGRPLSNMAMLMLLRDLRKASPCTGSGQRSRRGRGSAPTSRGRSWKRRWRMHLVMRSSWPTGAPTFSTSGGRSWRSGRGSVSAPVSALIRLWGGGARAPCTEALW